MRKVFIQEIVTSKEIDKIERDLKLFTKNIRRIKSGRDLFDAKKAWRQYIEDIDRFIWHDILGRNTERHDIADLFYEDFKYINNLLYSNPFFPKPGEYGLIDMRYESYLDKVGSAYQNNYPIPYNEDYYNEIYKIWNNDRDYFYQKTGREIRNVISLLKKVLDYYQGQIPEKAKIEYYKIQGVDVEFAYNEMIDQKYVQQTIKKFISLVKEVVPIIATSKKVAASLKSLLVKYDMADTFYNQYKNSLIAGYYYEQKDFIAIRYLGIDKHTLIHEIGHRYYHRFMPKKYSEIWANYIQNKYVEINEDIIKEFTKIFWQCYQQEKYDDELTKITLQGIGEDMKKYFTDTFMLSVFIPALKIVGGLNGTPISTKWEKEHPKRKDQAGWLIDWFIDRLKREEKINLLFTSDYGNMNPKEAYAETFAQFFSDNELKSQISDEIMDLFYYVTF